MTKDLHGLIGSPLGPTSPDARQWLAKLARKLARRLHRLALHLTRRSAPPRPVELEFYAEAGAPEGALYVDGQLVGHLEGVQRL